MAGALESPAALQQQQQQQQQQEQQQQQAGPPRGDESEPELELAGACDAALLARTAVGRLLPVRSLGHGAFAAVDLCSMPAADGRRKLLVRKTLVQAAAAAAAAAKGPLAALKPSSPCDWTREAAMHRAAAGCPFVLQLLAAKRCRTGNLLLFTEFARSGSMTGLLAARQQRQRQRRALGEQPVLVALPPSSGGAGSPGAGAGAPAPASAVLIHGVDVSLASAELEPTPAPAAAAAAAGAPSHGHGLPEPAARFYVACIVCALEWLHDRRIVHRDIKPCNLLICCDGYLKLADLGCCVALPPGVAGARTRTGTASYMAPEVTAGAAPYSFPVDMWSLGVTLWEMVAGCLPAWAAQQEQDAHGAGPGSAPPAAGQLPLQPEQHAHHFTPRPLEFPPSFSPALCDLLSDLLAEDSDARPSVREVQQATWFGGFDWAALQDRTLAPPRVCPAGLPLPGCS